MPKSNSPDPSCLHVLVDGVPWYEYGIEYRHDGGTFTFCIYAENEDDAKRRLRSIAGNGEIYGQIGGRFDASPKLAPFIGVWMSLKCWCKNLFI